MIVVNYQNELIDLFVHFFCPSKRNEPKKKRREMITSAKTFARYTGHIGTTVLPEVRAISGLPTHCYLLS